MVLGDNLYGKMILLDVDVGIASHGFHQSALDLGTRIVGMVEDAELGMSALAMQVEAAILLLVEVHTPFHQFGNLLRGLAHHLLDGLAVGDVVACDEGIGDVFVEGIQFHVGDRGHAALCKRGVCLVERGLADHADTTFT